jgi:hypothetical protein
VGFEIEARSLIELEDKMRSIRLALEEVLDHYATEIVEQSHFIHVTITPYYRPPEPLKTSIGKRIELLVLLPGVHTKFVFSRLTDGTELVGQWFTR